SRMRRRHIPHSSVPVPTTGGDAPAIGANRHAGDTARMSLEGELLLARGRVPHFHGPVVASRNDPLAVGAERHAPDTARVPLEGKSLLAPGAVPHRHLTRLSGQSSSPTDPQDAGAEG